LAEVSDQNKGQVEAIVFDTKRMVDEAKEAGRQESAAQIADLEAQLEAKKIEGEDAVIAAIKSGLGLF
jgi:hypothetical protein